MRIAKSQLKQIIREVIEEARLPDTMGAGYGDPQDDEREDAMGPRTPHEFSLTQKWEEDLAMYIRVLNGELQSLDRHTKKGNRYARNLDGAYHMVISRLKEMQRDLDRDLPVRRHGQDEPIDPTKWVEAPSKMEQDQVEKAVGLVQNAFATMARGEPVDHIQLKKDIQSAWPYGSRQYWSAKGGKSKTGGGYEYDPEMDTPTYFENLQKIIKEELQEFMGRPRPRYGEGNLTINDVKELLPQLSSGEQTDVWEKYKHLNNQDDLRRALKMNEEENNPWAICTASVGREDKEKYEKCVKSVKKQNRSK